MSQAAVSKAPPPRARRSLVEGSVFRHLLRFVVPMSVALSAMMATSLINAFWLGRLSTEALAASSFAVPVMFTVMSVAIGLSSGTVAAVARVAGTGDPERLRRLATDALMISVVVVAAISVLGALSSRFIFTAMGARGQVLDYATVFAQIWFLGNVFVAVPVIANGMLRAVGEAVLPSILMTTSALVNMVLDPVFIFGLGPIPRLEVAGAAIATVIANAVAAAAVMWLVAFRERLFAFSLPSREVFVRHAREIMRVGAPAMISNMVNPLALALVVASLARFGAATVAGYGAAQRLESFAVIPLFALSAAIGPLTGQNGGAGRLDRVRESFRASFAMCGVWSLGLAVVLAGLGPLLAPAFSADPAAQAAMRNYLWVTPITTWGYGVVITASAGFNGLSKPVPGLLMTVGRSIVLLTAFAWVGGTLWGPVGAFFGIAGANVMAGLLVAAWVLGRAYPPVPAPASAEPEPVAAPPLDAAPADR